MTYEEFLKTKELKIIEAGFDADESLLPDSIFDFQRDIVKWACKKGKAAILIGTGLGKSICQLSWAYQVYKHTGKNILIIAPLSVTTQTAKEARKFGINDVWICRTQADVKDGINITNYEMVDHFETSSFVGVVLDESSIIKNFTSKTTVEFTDKFCRTPYKLLCSASVCPNDYTEIGTSAEFLGIMSRTEMLATYFVHDGGKTSDWRLKKAAVGKFWEWVATWAICFNNPNELGYEIEGYNLPPLQMHTIITESEIAENELFVRVAETLSERRQARKDSMEDRTNKTAELTRSNDDQWLVWVDYNDESDIVHKKIEGSVEVKGSDTPEYKAEMSEKFVNGEIKTLVSKCSIFGFGLNMQGCHQQIFCGLSDSWERFYQAIRRSWRFGQTKPVDVYIILSERELSVLENIKRKEQQNQQMQKEMTARMKSVALAEIQHTTRITTTYKPEVTMELPSFMKGA